MTHAQIMRALSGLLLGLFCAILSSTVVTNALPPIIGDLCGGQSAYIWVVTSSLLTVTASTPLWGKLADQFSKKILVQSALVIFVCLFVGVPFAMVRAAPAGEGAVPESCARPARKAVGRRPG